MSIEVHLRTAIASRYSDEAADLWQTQLASGALNWVSLAQYASNIGLAPLLHDTLNEANRSLISPDVAAILKNEYYKAAGLNTLLLQELGALLKALDSGNVEAALLKGAALVLDVYPSPALRPMVDVDILFRFRDRLAAREELRKLGYGDLTPHPFTDESGLIWTQEILVHGGQQKPVLELHWHLLDNPYYSSRISTSELLERSRELMYEDTAYRTLSLEDQLIHLCCHNLLHHYGGFTRSLVDGAFLIDKYRDSILWDVIVERAEKSDLNLAVGSFLHQLASAWFVEVPEEVLVRSAAWTPSVNERLSAWSQRNEFLRASKKLIGLPGLKNKARFVTGQLFPDREYLAWRYEIPEDSPAIYAYTKRYLSGIESMARSVVGRPKTKKGSPDFQSDEP